MKIILSQVLREYVLTRKVQRPSRKRVGLSNPKRTPSERKMIWSGLHGNVQQSFQDDCGVTNHSEHKRDTSFMNQLTGNTYETDTKKTGNNSVTAPDNDHWILATGVAGTNVEASLSASSVFSLTLIDRAVTKAETISPRIRPSKVGGEEKYVILIHPYQLYQLRTNTNTAQWIDIQKAAMTGGQISKNPIYTGSAGEYNKTIIHVSTRVPVPVTSVCRAVFCGAQAGVVCTGRQTKEGLDATWTEELFDSNSWGPLSSDAYSKGCELGEHLWN